MADYAREFIRDNGEVVEITYTLSPFYSARTNCDPEFSYPDGGGDLEHYVVGDGSTTLTDAEARRFDEEVYANMPDSDDAFDDYDARWDDVF